MSTQPECKQLKMHNVADIEHKRRTLFPRVHQKSDREKALQRQTYININSIAYKL